MAMHAVDSGRQRQLLQQAQALAAEIRSLPLDLASIEHSLPRLFELARYVKRFLDTTACMPQDQTRVMWEQRGKWLQEEVAALTAERLQAASGGQLQDQVMRLMFAAAHVCDTILREKADAEQQLKEVLGRTIAQMEGQLAAQQQQVEELQHQLAQQQAAAEAATQVAVSQQQLTEEVLELRSRLVMAQQEAHKRASDSQDAGQQLQMAAAERDQLQQRCDELTTEVAELKQDSERQVEVIRQLMERSEVGSSTHQQLAQEVGQLQQHNKTLSVNLESHAQVIEKLVELNTELMDKSNTLAFTAARQADSLQAAAAAAAAGGAGDHPGLVGPPPLGPPMMPSSPVPPGVSSVPLDPAQPPPHQHHHHHHHHQLRSQVSSSSYPTPPLSYNAVAPPSVGGSHAWQPLPQKDSSWRGSFDYGRGPPPPPHMGNPHAATNGSGPHPAWLPPAGPSPISDSPPPAQPAAPAAGGGAAGGGAPSLTDAFSAFLMQPDEPKAATANSLAEPAGGPASGGKARMGGLLGTAKTLVKYVAGSEQAKQQGQPGAEQAVGNGAAH